MSQPSLSFLPDHRSGVSTPRYAHLLLLTLLVCLLLVPGCDQGIKVSDQNITAIPYKELAALLGSAKPQDVVLVDVRSLQDFNNGHLPGAIHIFLPDLVAGDKRLGTAKHIIVYGSGWSDVLSRAGTKRLMALGYKGVQDFRGGVEAWRAQGKLLAVTREPADNSQETGETGQ